MIQGILMNLLFGISISEAQSLKSVRITMADKQLKLEEAFEFIEEKTHFNFFYVTENIPLDNKVNLKIIETSLFEVLQNIAIQQHLVFERVSNQIVVKAAKNEKPGIKGYIKIKANYFFLTNFLRLYFRTVKIYLNGFILIK